MLVEDVIQIVLRKPLTIRWNGHAWLAPLAIGRITNEQGEGLKNGTPTEGNIIVLWVDNLGVKWNKEVLR